MARFVIREVTTGVKFDLLAPNGQDILTSGVYVCEAACRKGIASVVKNAAAAGRDLYRDNCRHASRYRSAGRKMRLQNPDDLSLDRQGYQADENGQTELSCRS